MDWDLAVNRNRDQLLRIIVALFAMAGLAEGGSVATLPRHVYRAVLLILRPAESAIRRLIIIAARGLALRECPRRAAPLGLIPHDGIARRPVFPLIDPLKRFALATPAATVLGSGPWMPRISVPGLYDPVFLPTAPVPSAEDPISAQRLCLRLYALQRALDDLPRQARRLARWRARQNFALESQSPYRSARLSPVRPGRPPGHCKRPTHEVDDVLRECHALALDVCARPDSS